VRLLDSSRSSVPTQLPGSFRLRAARLDALNLKSVDSQADAFSRARAPHGRIRVRGPLIRPRLVSSKVVTRYQR
jgi:hypothetical protein